MASTDKYLAYFPDEIEYLFPFTYYTKKWEWVYMDGVPVLENTLYSFLRPKDQKMELYFTVPREYSRKEMIDMELDKSLIEDLSFNVILRRDIPLISDYSTFQQYYRFANPENQQREIYLTPSIILVTKQMRNGGLIKRFFARSILEREKLFEIDEFKYESNTSFYEKVQLLWVLKGKKERVKKANNRFLTEADKIMSGIRDFLDPLEFYKEELTPLEELQERLGTGPSDSTPPYLYRDTDMDKKGGPTPPGGGYSPPGGGGGSRY